jgi:hypothetical protein
MATSMIANRSHKGNLDYNSNIRMPFSRHCCRAAFKGTGLLEVARLTRNTVTLDLSITGQKRR